MRPNTLIDMFKAGRPSLVGWMSIAHPYAAEMMGHAGYDAVCVDLQHGPFYLDAAVPTLQALSSTPALAIARCSANNFFEINKLLDAGAYGIICPMIDSVGDAERFVSACRYPPQGTRSFGPARGVVYGGADYYEHANDAMLTLGMIETPQGLEQVEAIAAVEGLHGLFIGPSDLSLALGVSPNPKWNEAPLTDAIDRIQAAARKHGKIAGVFCGNQAMMVDMKKRGFDLVVHGTDSALLRAAAEQVVGTFRNA
ncbi:MAG: 2,4-dihydroxyhept-2-ene-1,7-dioic acid aldolase [Burkholderiaceae bacterium]|nr:2,4-dihydroxyhept-2-ene-1,7-dioic acid aldolase [Burkholderiaceae bacterium]